ncbi:MAG: LysM peptidoglycan-binding domain-containing protein [Bdellovibrionales bacterium]|nr:LysM peptidoglycan-binding domain-containing protein [Bdellovibrionales bacterium]
MLKFLLTTGLVAAASHAAAKFDPPDLSFELELHRQHMRRQGLQGDTPQLARDAYVESYKIQNGETLWSLSGILYGDGAYWPRVWAQNHGISNPHLIRPGHTLQFLMGSEDDTPAFRITEEDEENGLELVASSSNPVIEIPPPEIPPKPVLKVPASFPEWQSVFKAQPKDMLDDRGLDFKWKKLPDRIFLRAWVDEKELDPVGHFLENDKEAGLPVINQYVFIKVKKGRAQVGQKMMIVHDAGPIRRVSEYLDDDDRPAYLTQVAGELEITETATCKFNRSRDRENFDCYRALMTKTTGLSLKDNALVAGELPIVDLTPSNEHGTTVAQVLGSEKHNSSMLMGQGDLVFLNKGSAAGVQPGQMLDIFVNRKSRHTETPVEFSPVPSGTVKVVRVSNEFATAVILNAHDGILQGDRVQEVSARKGDTERRGDPLLKSVPGGTIDNDDLRFEMDETDIESDISNEL